MHEAIVAVDPEQRTAHVVRKLQSVGEWSLLAIGKAAAAMARGAIAGWDRAPARSLIVVPEGVASDGLPGKVMRSDHPVPTGRSAAAGRSVAEFVRQAAQRGHQGGRERLVACVSGGASALVCFVPEAEVGSEVISVERIGAVTRALLRSGARIRELNLVRKGIEKYKGGGLAKLLGGSVMTDVLVVSDVLGDDVSVIGSGVFAPSEGDAAGAIRILEMYGLIGRFADVAEYLRLRATEAACEDDGAFANVRHHVILSNVDAVRAAAQALQRHGCDVEVRLGVEGEAVVRGREFAGVVASGGAQRGGVRAVVWGGETTVSIGEQVESELAGSAGGRNQEAALAAALGLDGAADVCVGCMATDGVDGITPPGLDAHAGAIVDGETVVAARARGVDLEGALRRHESYQACRVLGAAMRTGTTGTNVNDVWLGVRRS